TFIDLIAGSSETTNTTIVIPKLEPSTPYECRAYAVNAIGIGPYSNSIIIRTLDEPIVKLDQVTDTLSWTRHENKEYTCVKVETRRIDVKWHVVTNCVNQYELEYKVNDTTSDYRITYCIEDESCESYEFVALTMSTINDCICASSSVGIIVGILITLLVTTITAVVISYVLHKRRWSQEKTQSAAKEDRDYTGLSSIGMEEKDTPMKYQKKR
ncbi:uncharacterized protein LOC144341845, partial [Saccoglossus kowalevskii]